MQRKHLSKQMNRNIFLVAVTLLGRAAEEEFAFSEELKITNAELLPLSLPTISLCNVYFVD